MPHIDWNGVEEREGAGGVETLPSGAYECVVTKAAYKRSKQGNPYLELVWDVASGPSKGFFSAKFFSNKDFRHNDVLSLSGNAMGFTKHKLHCLADANPGFMPTTFVERDESQPFVGKRCFLLLQERRYSYNGRDQSEVRVVRWLKPEDFKAGRFEVPETLDERDAAPVSAVPAPPMPEAVLADEDIPF